MKRESNEENKMQRESNGKIRKKNDKINDDNGLFHESKDEKWTGR